MQRFIVLVAVVFLILLLANYGLSFAGAGDVSDELLLVVEWVKDVAGVVLALGVIVYRVSGGT